MTRRVREAARSLTPLTDATGTLAYRARCDLAPDVVSAYNEHPHSRSHVERIYAELALLWTGDVVPRPTLLTDAWSIHFAGRCADWQPIVPTFFLGCALLSPAR